MAGRRRGYVNIWCRIPAISGNIHNETLMQISLSLGSMGGDFKTSRGTYSTGTGGRRGLWGKQLGVCPEHRSVCTVSGRSESG